MTRVQRLRAADAAERRAAIAELAPGPTPAADELAALADCLGDRRKAVQRPAAEALAAFAARDGRVHDVLLALLDAASPSVRWGATFALSLAGAPPARALPVLVETLGCDDGDLRWAAARILPRVAERDATVILLRDLSGSGNAAQRKMALYCLRDLDARGADVESATLARLADADRDVRLAAVATLARLALDRPRAAARLVDVLAQDEPPVRRAAAAALGALGEGAPAVVSALEQAARGDDPALARAAERALAALRG